MPIAYATCPLCEATCGLEVTLHKGAVTAVRGDDRDVLSHGYICPKGALIGALHADPDRLRTPLIRRGGRLAEASWDEALAEVAARLPAIIGTHGPDAVAIYSGNPPSHNVSMLLYAPMLYKAIGTTNFYTAASVDTLPKYFASGYLFGRPLAIAVPDLDRTGHLLILGANPLVSNGSLMTAPDIRGRLRAIRRRGGKVVVVDPCRTRTAAAADEHHAIRPGTDALLLFALVHVLFAENLVRLRHLAPVVAGADEVRALAEEFTPQAVAPLTGLDADVIRRMARELAAAERAVVYGRVGTCSQSFGTLASWLVDVLNVLTGNLDREGGAMFPLAATQRVGTGGGRRQPFAAGRWRTRVRGLPEVAGEVPVATLADEIETPGDGQVRALITVAGNPCVSTPNPVRLTRALRQLEFMLALDIYVNETTRLADVVLPGPGPLERPHYDAVLYPLAIRNVANWTPAVLPSPVPQDWETLLRLTSIVEGLGPDPDVHAVDDRIAAGRARRAGIDPASLGGHRGPARLIDLKLREGAYSLTLADLEAAPHGVDLGPLRPRLSEVLATASGKIELAPGPVVADVPRLAAELGKAPTEQLVLIGRRQLHSNNSWMHNLRPLVRGRNRCTLQVHPADAARLGLREGVIAEVSGRTGMIRVPVEVTGEMRPGTVSIPHGWGHDADGLRIAVAQAHPGANSNILTDELVLDEPSGNAVLNGIPVEVRPAAGSNSTSATTCENSR